MNKPLSRKTNLGNFPPSKYKDLCMMLNDGDAWKDLACVILNRRKSGPRFSTDDVHHFERKADPADQLLRSWRADSVTLGDLISALDAAKLRRLSDFVCQIVEPFLVAYESLAVWTHDFDRKSPQDGGNFLGEGGFSEVFKGFHPAKNCWVAVKRMNTDDASAADVKTRTEKEIQLLSRCCHKNLLSLLGYSSDGPACCLIYEYMAQASLEDRLACRNNSLALTVSQRIIIMQDAVSGVAYLHKNGIIHRDIKSANILLDDEFRAKLGDYGISRIGPQSSETTETSAIIGTTVYMAPEYLMMGTVSYKIDSFSFGVVLLEVLTGLPALDEGREEISLVSHIQENYAGNIDGIIDAKATNWLSESYTSVYSMSERLLSDTALRPDILEIVDEIQSWSA